MRDQQNHHHNSFTIKRVGDGAYNLRRNKGLMRNKHHFLELHQTHFKAVKDGKKNFDVRNYSIEVKGGDRITFIETLEMTNKPTGESVDVVVTYVYRSQAILKFGHAIVNFKLASLDRMLSMTANMALQRVDMNGEHSLFKQLEILANGITELEAEVEAYRHLSNTLLRTFDKHLHLLKHDDRRELDLAINAIKLKANENTKQVLSLAN